MKNNSIYALLLLTLTAIGMKAQTVLEPMEQVVERGLQRATSQSLLLADALKERQDALPRTFEKGAVQTIRYDHWVSGFFPGVLWMLYENAGNQQLRQLAEMYTDRVEPAKRMTNTHALGFMLYCSFGQGYRLTGNRHYLDVIKEGTQSLHTRWNDRLGGIKSWESGPKWQYPAIIANMMNLEMLCFMTRETGDRRYERIAERHANTTMKNHFREDYSTFHVVSYDTITGQPHTFDPNGWLRIGYTGSQIRMSEDYINTGSLYLCTAALLPLGLPADDPFWAAPARDWTAKKAWNGEDVGADHAIG